MQRLPLHRLEKRVLAALREGPLTLEALCDKASVNPDQARMAVEGLKEKGLVRVIVEKRGYVRVSEAGLRAAKIGLPERRLLSMVEKSEGKLRLSLAARAFGDEFDAALGHALKNRWLKIALEEGERYLVLTGEAGKSAHESLLELVAKRGAIPIDEFSPDQLETAKDLKRRADYVTIEYEELVKVEPTAEGLVLAKRLRAAREVGALTPQHLVSGEWKKLTFTPYDVTVPISTIASGRKHIMTELIEEIREIFVSMGFEEIDGPLVELAFWNFDALFQPQDHPARDMQDTFYISGLRGEIDASEETVNLVKSVHERGEPFGSKGWGGTWSIEEARKLVMRTHTTAVTVKKLYEVGGREGYYFAIGRVFRNEKPDFKHTAEFYQVDGIVISKQANIRQLMGIVQEFYKRLGLKKVRFWPSYFPYTEPSIQTSVYVEKLGNWVELCGMGIFRPEVTLPLGVKYPVLAWGAGLERIAMIRHGIDDIRELYYNRLSLLQGRRTCRLLP